MPASPAAYVTLSPLIGEWEVGPEGAPAAFIERFSWGTGRAYVWLSVALIQGSADEHLHFEGPIVWNAASQRYDYLFVVEPGSLVQEKGEIYAGEDGMIVRDVLLTAADGSSQPVSPDIPRPRRRKHGNFADAADQRWLGADVSAQPTPDHEASRGLTRHRSIRCLC